MFCKYLYITTAAAEVSPEGNSKGPSLAPSGRGQLELSVLRLGISMNFHCKSSIWGYPHDETSESRIILVCYDKFSKKLVDHLRF